MSATAPLTTNSRTTWWLQASTLALLGAFVLPACLTSQLWRDNRTHDDRLLSHWDEPLRTWADQDDAGAHIVELTEAVARQLHEAGADVPATACWLRVQLPQPATTGEAHGSRRLHFVTREAPRSANWALMQPDYHVLRGTRWDETPVAVRATTAPPPVVGSPLADTQLYHHHIRDDGTWLVTRIAATPLTIVGDVLLFAIFWPILVL